MEGTTDIPFLMSERVTPPTEIEWSVTERPKGLVELRISRNSREVNDQLVMEPEDAILLADKLEEVAEQVDD